VAASFAAHDRAWKLDRALAEARDRTRALAVALALRLEPDLTLDLADTDLLRDLHVVLRRPLAFDVAFVLAGGDPDEQLLAQDMAREERRIMALDHAIDLVRGIARRCPRAVGRRRARALERSLRQARRQSLRLDRALGNVRARNALSLSPALTVEAPLLTWMARLLPPDIRARFVEEQAAGLSSCHGWMERFDYLLGLLAGLPGIAWDLRR
jgi:hypothetical protein